MKIRVKTARKQFRCESCPKPILAGETYCQAGKKRRHLTHGATATPISHATVAEKTLQHVIKNKPVFDQRVLMSTGHQKYPNRSAEAQFILEQFENNYKKSQLKKGLRGRVIREVREAIRPPMGGITPEISPDLIFRLRTVYHRSKKLMDAEVTHELH